MLLKEAWLLLGIPAGTADLATIKRAYAQKIRQYRPDEQPEMFAKVHSAYQLLRRQVRANSPTMPTSEPSTAFASWLNQPTTTDVTTDVTANINVARSAEPLDIAAEPSTSDCIAELVQQVERVLAQMPDLAQVQQWQFLAQPLLLDATTHWQLSREVFLRIVQHHRLPSSFASDSVRRDPRRRPIRMPVMVLQYLDSLLQWQHHREALLNLPVGAEGQQVFNRLDQSPALDITRTLRGRAPVIRREPTKPSAPVQFEQIIGGFCVGAYLLYSLFRHM